MAAAATAALIGGDRGGRAGGVELSEGGCPRSPPGGVEIMIVCLPCMPHAHAPPSVTAVASSAQGSGLKDVIIRCKASFAHVEQVPLAAQHAQLQSRTLVKR